jgi:hypothetical protein
MITRRTSSPGKPPKTAESQPPTEHIIPFVATVIAPPSVGGIGLMVCTNAEVGHSTQ